MAKKASNTLYEKLSPKTLVSLGLSAKSEKYREKATGKIVSKRQYQKTLETRLGKSNEKVAREYKEGKRTYKSGAQNKAAQGRQTQSRKLKAFNRYIKELTANGKEFNRELLEESIRNNPRVWDQASLDDLSKLASRRWGKVKDPKADVWKFQIEEYLDKDYEDEGLSPFFYH